MTVPRCGPRLQSRRRIGGEERRVLDKHPVVAQPIRAAVRAIPDLDGTNRNRGAQVYLPPRIRVEIGMRNGIVVENPIRIRINSTLFPYTTLFRSKGAALRRRFSY